MTIAEDDTRTIRDSNEMQDLNYLLEQEQETSTELLLSSALENPHAIVVVPTTVQGGGGAVGAKRGIIIQSTITNRLVERRTNNLLPFLSSR